jgi:hypothetical protein
MLDMRQSRSPAAEEFSDISILPAWFTEGLNLEPALLASLDIE